MNTNRNDWPKWKKKIQVESTSLEKREVFGPIVRTPEGVKQWGTNGFLCENEIKMVNS